MESKGAAGAKDALKIALRQWRIKGGRGGRSPPQEHDELGNPRCLKEVKEEEKNKK